MKNLEEKINEAITNDLPNQIGKALKQKLEEAERNDEMIRNQDVLLKDNKNKISQLNEVINEYKKLDERNLKLDERELSILEMVQNSKVSELEYKLASEKEKTEFSKSVALGLVRNIEYRKDVFNSKTTPTIDQYGSTQHLSTTDNNNETTKAE